MVLLKLAIFSALAASVLSLPELFYFCHDKTTANPYIMEMFVRSDGEAVVSGSVHSVVNSAYFLCDNSPANFLSNVVEIPGTGTIGDPVKLEVTVNPSNGAMDPSACGLSLGSLSYKWPIMAHFTGLQDAVNNLACDFNDPTMLETAVVKSAAVTLTSPPPIIAMDFVDFVKLSLVSGSFQPLSAIGPSNILQVDFTFTGAVYYPEPDVTGVYTHSCHMCDADDCSGGFDEQISDSNGCPVGSVLSAGLTGTAKQQRSPLLNLGVLYGSSIPYVYFVCGYNFCTSSSPAGLCQDSCSVLVSGKKRKRSIDKVLSKQHFLDTDFHNNQARERRSPDSQPRTSVRSKCQMSTRFAVTMGTLVSIFALAVLISIIQCVRLFSIRKE